jgi:hypothetical protein
MDCISFRWRRGSSASCGERLGRVALPQERECGGSRPSRSTNLERIELELQRDLRPPRSVFDDKMRFQVEPARGGDRPDLLDADLAVAALPTGDRCLAQSESLG